MGKNHLPSLLWAFLLGKVIVESTCVKVDLENAVGRLFHATSVSEGMGMARCVVLYGERPAIAERTIRPEEIESEVERFSKALIQTSEQLQKVAERVKEVLGGDNAGIFESHQLVMEDQMFLDEVIRMIREQRLPADLAAQRVSLKYVHFFENVPDEYFRQRVADIKDVTTRLVDNLTGWSQHSGHSQLTEPSILVSADLTPSQTVQINREMIAGIVTEQGGITSHVGILARSLKIPAVAGMQRATEVFKTGQRLLVDGYRGIVILSPTEEEIHSYDEQVEQERELAHSLEEDAAKPVTTLDGRNIILAANLGQPAEAEHAVEAGANGVGLLRTEFLFFNRDTLPSEDEQYEDYLKVASCMGERPVVIRTLDLGADKKTSILEFPFEENPFLGYRAIRYCLQNNSVFKAQLRALLRASAVAGNIKIMYPMISGVEEFNAAQKVLRECMEELEREGKAYNPQIEVGVMIEIPSAVLCAGELARKAAFFSIGTNDLIQYTLAVDRMNPNVNYLYQPTHPAIIRMISSTVEGARHGNGHGGIPVCICGEMAGDVELTPLLIGLGIDELSISVPNMMKVRRVIQRAYFNDCYKLACQALRMGDPVQIMKLSSDFVRVVAPELFLER